MVVTMCAELAMFENVLRPYTALILRTTLWVEALISILQMFEQGVSYFHPTPDLWAVVGPGSSWRGPQCACFGFLLNCHLQPWNSSPSFAVTTEFCECAFRVKVIFSFLSFGELYQCFFYFWSVKVMHTLWRKMSENTVQRRKKTKKLELLQCKWRRIKER